MLYTLAAGLTRGARASILAAFACTLGIIPHMAAAITGLAALLHTSALAFEIIKYLGVAYLLYMAWATLREKGALSVEHRGQRAKSVRQVLVSGHPDQHPQPKTLDLLLRLPAAVRQDGTIPPTPYPDAGVERGVHGSDLCDLRHLRHLRSRCAPAHRYPPAASSPGCAALSLPPSSRSAPNWRFRSASRQVAPGQVPGLSIRSPCLRPLKRVPAFAALAQKLARVPSHRHRCFIEVLYGFLLH